MKVIPELLEECKIKILMHYAKELKSNHPGITLAEISLAVDNNMDKITKDITELYATTYEMLLDELEDKNSG